MTEGRVGVLLPDGARGGRGKTRYHLLRHFKLHACQVACTVPTGAGTLITCDLCDRNGLRGLVVTSSAWTTVTVPGVPFHVLFCLPFSFKFLSIRLTSHPLLTSPA